MAYLYMVGTWQWKSTHQQRDLRFITMTDQRDRLLFVFGKRPKFHQHIRNKVFHSTFQYLSDTPVSEVMMKGRWSPES